MKYQQIALALFVFCVLGAYECYGQSNSLVTNLTDSNYINHIESGTWFIMFYAPWCKHCQQFKPTWEELAQKLQGEINMGAVDW